MYFSSCNCAVLLQLAGLSSYSFKCWCGIVPLCALTVEQRQSLWKRAAPRHQSGKGVLWCVSVVVVRWCIAKLCTLCIPSQGCFSGSILRHLLWASPWGQAGWEGTQFVFLWSLCDCTLTVWQWRCIMDQVPLSCVFRATTKCTHTHIETHTLQAPVGVGESVCVCVCVNAI